MNNDILLLFYSRPETVFTINEIAQIFPQVSYKSLKNRLYYFTKVGKLLNIHKGIYAKPNYNFSELANKIYKPSYISLETVLVKEGMIFQYYETIYLASYVTRNIMVDKKTIQYRRLRKDILTNIEGIIQENGYFIATLERAFLDALYIYKNYHFDNLGVVDWKKVESLKRIYKSKVLEKRIKEYFKIYKEEK